MKSKEKLNRLRELYKDNQKISSILDNIDIKNSSQIENAWKILSNKRIIESIDIEKFEEIINSIIIEDDNSYKNICELIRTVYGEDAEKIIKERPELSMNDIPNFDIFDEQIRETIGYGGVQTFLTYYMDSEQVITKLAQNPDLIRYYKEFEKLTGEFFPPSAIGLEDRLIAFYKHIGLIQEIVDSGKKEEYTGNLCLLLRDEEGFYDVFKFMSVHGKIVFDYKEDFKVETLEDLENYERKRNEVIERYIEQVPDLLHPSEINANKKRLVMV